jgi:predicted O-methyltransferase YrrM
MNSVLTRILETNRVELPDGSTTELHSNVTEAEGAYLQSIIRAIRPAASLEIGFAYGVSTLYICEALAEVGGRHTVIDPQQSSAWRAAGLSNLERAGFGAIVSVIEDPSYRALPQLEAEGRRFDFAFIDGVHTFDYALTDFFLVDKVLKPGGVVVFDDAPMPAIAKVIRYALTNLPYRVHDPQRQTPSLLRRLIASTPLRRIAKPEIMQWRGSLGIPKRRSVALVKTRDDVLGDGTNGTRHWGAHQEF